MYITENYFYSTKALPLPPTPKTPLKQAYRNKDLLGARNVQIFTPGRIFNFWQFVSSNFCHYQEFQYSERHLIKGHRQKPASLILAQNADSQNCRAEVLVTKWHPGCPIPRNSGPCVILLITLAKTGADEFTPSDEFSRHPKTTTILTQSQLNNHSKLLSPSKVMNIANI